MKPGSVIVDMAAEQGGNCELTEPGQAVVKHGVTIVGYTDLASRLAKQSSTLYSTNLLRLTEELCKTKDGVIDVNMEDDAIRGLTVVKEGSITWPPPPPKLPAAPPQRQAGRGAAGRAQEGPRPRRRRADVGARSLAIVFGVGALLFLLVGLYAPAVVPRALHGVRARLLRRLHGGLERDARAAHAAHERDQRHLDASSPSARWCRSRRRSRRRGRPPARRVILGLAVARARARPPSTCSAASRSRGACWRCSASKRSARHDCQASPPSPTSAPPSSSS